MNKNMIETITGALILGIAAWFLMFFMDQNTGVSVAGNHYNLTAKFEQADGIAVGTPVKIGGVKVGVITDQELDPRTYFAVIKMSLNDKIKVPTDSIAKISSEGLIGGKYLSIVPGADDNMINKNGEIQFTQSSISLETLISKMVFSSSNDEEDNSTKN
ncbi:MAG: outer membrane lipid asymmetry maintenance protein MlaD [Rickettsiales bacterium]|jgi:phospholipid/cholesterol/gamma-HCH transport system substrate-binding protein|nr:outer membrane lipid asymmetry maintenance protein MlaD [Rickettsiales bacterium]